MSSFFKGDLLDEFALNKEKFETVVGLGSSHNEVRMMFCLGLLAWNGEDTYGLDVKEYLDKNCQHIESLLDKWCLENYRIPYNSVYGLIQQSTVKHFEDLMLELGVRGNPSAIAIANEVVRKKENSGVVVVNFVNSLPAETESDKEDD